MPTSHFLTSTTSCVVIRERLESFIRIRMNEHASTLSWTMLFPLRLPAFNHTSRHRWRKTRGSCKSFYKKAREDTLLDYALPAPFFLPWTTSCAVTTGRLEIRAPGSHQQARNDTLPTIICLLPLLALCHVSRHHYEETGDLCQWQPSTSMERHSPCYTSSGLSSGGLPSPAASPQEDQYSVSMAAINRRRRTFPQPYFA